MRGQVIARAVQMTVAKTSASVLMASDSERTDRFHKVMGRAEANARITQTATTRCHPGTTSRPTVQASAPQASAPMTAWVAV